MIIRQEEQKDYGEIAQVIKEAFEKAEHTDGNEFVLVERLRSSGGFIKQLALVAEENNEIIGHIMFTKVKVCEKPGLALAPLSVVPKAQKKGVGTALMKRAHEIAIEMGFEFSVVVGSEKYYPKVGYKKASVFGIKAPFDVPDDNFMVLFFGENARDIKGTVVYVKEMFES